MGTKKTGNTIKAFFKREIRRCMLHGALVQAISHSGCSDDRRSLLFALDSEGFKLEVGNALPDHIHLLLSIPPKYSLAMTIGYLKSKSAIRIHRQVLKTKGTLFGRSFWARGYCVSTVGLDEHQIKKYIKEQEHIQKEQDQLELDFD